MAPLTKKILAKKSLGQHFLVDAGCCRRIVRLAGIGDADLVIEIGAGTGLLTRELLKASRRVIAVEFDRDMVEILRRHWPPGSNPDLEIVQANALRLDWNGLMAGSGCRIAGNLPYNISTRLIREMIEIKNRFHSATFMVQKEVAHRILAPVGGAEYGGFSVLIQRFFQVQPGFDVPPGAFSPPPRVWSHVLKLVPRQQADPKERRSLERLLRAAFGQRRKTLGNNLKAMGLPPEKVGNALSIAGVDARKRPQQLGYEDYCRLSQAL